MLKTKTALTLSDKIIIQLKLTGIICRSANIKYNECEAATIARLKNLVTLFRSKALLVGIMFILTLNHQKFMIYSKGKQRQNVF